MSRSGRATRNRAAWGFLAALALATAILADTTPAPAAAPVGVPALAPLTPGAVITLVGTANLWVTDDQGILHFAGDPRALAGRPVDWSNRLELTPAQLAALPRGDPWLSAALVQIGNAIYLPQWDLAMSATVPTLRHVASQSDLALLGVTAANYGQWVLDQASWEGQYDLAIRTLPFGGDLVLTTVPVVPTIPPESIPEPTLEPGK